MNRYCIHRSASIKGYWVIVDGDTLREYPFTSRKDCLQAIWMVTQGELDIDLFIRSK